MLTQKGLSNTLVSILVLAFLAVGFSGGAFFYKWYKADKTIADLKDQVQSKESELKNIVKDKISGSGDQAKSSQEVIVTSTKSAIKVSSPQVGTEITDSVTLKGTADVFESQFSARLKDENGKVLVQASITANGDKSFEKTLSFKQVAKTQIGVIEVYDTSEKDGEIDDIATIQIILISK